LTHSLVEQFSDVDIKTFEEIMVVNHDLVEHGMRATHKVET